jgi:hypothetical protein
MKNFAFSASLLALAVVLMGAGSPKAFAYGSEGMFGGRPAPDESIVLGDPIALTNDRPDRAESVLDHPRPDFDPTPITVGSFEFFPSVEMGATYDTNIYATKTDPRSDLVNTIRPVVSGFSNWGRNALATTTFGDINLYNDHTRENYENFVTDWNGRYDIMNQEWVAFRGSYQHLAEPRTSPDAVNGTEPTTFNYENGGLTFYRGLGKVKVTADYDADRFDYNDADSSLGPIDESYRDMTKQRAGAQVRYDLTENFKPFVRAYYNRRDFDSNPEHNSQGYDAATGAIADFGGITSVEGYVGWMSQFYDDIVTVKKEVDAPLVGGRVEWNPTGLTSVVLEGTRTMEDTTVTGFNGYIASGGSATVTHELRRNLLIEADFGLTRSDYEGATERHDDDLSTGAGLRYLMTKNLYSDFLYNYSQRSSTDSTAEYDRHMVMLRLGVRM